MTMLHEEWRAAFQALVQRDDGTQIAALLRGVLVPFIGQAAAAFQAAAALQAAVAAGDQGAIAAALAQFNAVVAAGDQGDFNAVAAVSQSAAYDLAELLDPRSSLCPFVKRNLPLDQIEMVVNGDGKPMPRLKAAIEVEVAGRAARVERLRLVREQAKKLGIKLKEDTDTTALELSAEEFAERHGDQKALRAFADLKKAQARLAKTARAISPAVQLTVESLSEAHRARLDRTSRIVTEMIASVQPLFGPRRSVNKAAQRLGEKFGLSDRQVKKILAAARKTMPSGYLKDFGKTPVK